MINFSKGYKYLPQDLIIEELKAYGFNNISLRSLYYYFNVLNLVDILSFVTKASIIRTLLFSIFINDVFLLGNSNISRCGPNLSKIHICMEIDMKIYLQDLTKFSFKANPKTLIHSSKTKNSKDMQPKNEYIYLCSK